MEQHARRWALIIGVSAYDDTKDLSYTVNDARRLRDILESMGGFEPDHVYLLCDDPDNDNASSTRPTRANILQRTKFIAESASSDDLILVFFAGHGAEIEKKPYLLAADTKLDVLKETALDVNEWNGMLEASSADCIIRIFDACRTSQSLGRFTAGRMTQAFQDALFSSAAGWVTISACSSGEIAHEALEFEQGVFSYYLCEGLKGNAASKDGAVTLDGLVEYLRNSMDHWSKRQSQRQTPHVKYDISGNLVLTRIPAKLEEAAEPARKSPLRSLEFSLGEHLVATPSDARDLRFTDEQSWRKMSELALDEVSAAFDSFEHASLTIEASQLYGGFTKDSVTYFTEDMVELRVGSEYAGDVLVREFELKSSTAVVPSTRLVVVAARFSFFSWLWYRFLCHPVPFKTAFRATPPWTTGYIVLNPSALTDPEKRNAATTELLRRTSVTLMDWAEQLRAFVDERLEPMRKMRDQSE